MKGNEMVNKSALFQSYNAARAVVADTKRLNKALGIAQSSRPREYVTTATSCTCADSTYRPSLICKHRLAVVLVEASK